MNRLKSRYGLVIAGLLLANLMALLLNILLGDRAVPPLEALMTVAGMGTSDYDFTINTLRLPRALVGLLAGCGLAVAGVILQAVTRNPLASPGVIGLNSGASVAAVAVIVLFPAFPASRLPLVAFGGALLAAWLIYWLSWRRGSSPARMLLVGIGISAMAGAAVTYLLTVGGIFRVTQASIWMAGSLYGRSWEQLWPLLPWTLLLLPLIMILRRQLDVLQLGDELARGLGIRMERTRLLLIVVAVGFAGSAVAFTGPIGFIGLMAPHLARGLVGNISGKLLPAAALIGSLIVMLADLLGKTLFSPFEIPVGIVTAIIGAPYMIILLLRRKGL
ncbi:iron ABC transporter permease [Paenibacillaceae bacterium]|nr:iron ABC transporter permease [Paenibacillaceae bacterium]